MDITAIINPVLAIGGIGLIFGISLGIAAKKFAVPVDERVEAVKENLPGANCGGCGFAGCEALAKSIASGESKINACPVCNQNQTDEIAKVMGVEAARGVKNRDVVRCHGINASGGV
jgi:RnfABCDGE-type electron transport complex B subunit